MHPSCKKFLNKEISGKKDTQTTLLEHNILKSCDISNFVNVRDTKRCL